ncbi:hypothetical protein NON00_17425 [Roseomonas sp. GC11]|uniref:hypothetical protein n=1 Tax=Roseomonas sp. GC11 TaxID=2950546 RepID=UPI00210D2CFD|nr:hypothetical protein [Roseomonas sp. GC11]MCQ4161698.1 hypothetical protein [Roseomonas sp. GC11]
MPLPTGIAQALDKVTQGSASAATPRTEALGRYKVDAQVAGALRSAAKATGLGFEVLAAKAAMESGFRSDAQASTSSARGLFQFIDQTWLGVVQEHGAAHGLTQEAAAIVRDGSRLTVSDPAMRSRILALRDDPEISARLGAEHLKDLSEALRAPLGGRAPDATELYLGHFLGLRGATEFLRASVNDPGRAASDILPDAARANPSIFRGADGAPLSVQQVIDKLRGRISQVYSQLGLAAPAGPVDFKPTAQAPKAGTAVASEEPRWWGSGSPARISHPQEQSMVSTLVEVFNRMTRAAAARGRDEDSASLPGTVLSALREQSSATTTSAATAPALPAAADDILIEAQAAAQAAALAASAAEARRAYTSSTPL